MTTQLSISEIKIGKRHRQDVGDVQSLAESIEAIGLLHPVVVDGENRLVAGFRRLRALQHLGREKAPVHVAKNIDDAALHLAAELQENVFRKDFLISERAALDDAILRIEQPKAEEKKKAGKSKDGTAGGRGKKKPKSQVRTKVNQDNSARSANKAAKAAGWSPETARRAKEIIASGNQALIDEMNKTGKVNGVYKKLKRMRQVEEIRKEPPPMPDGPFRVLVADPPWLYGSRADDASHRAANPYPSMSIEQICELPVRERAERDAILWLWTTNAHLPEAFRVVEAWGFTYKTMLTWVKNKIGTGDWLRGQTEHCLLCVRGKPVMAAKAQSTSTVLHADMGRHSEKPEAFFRLVEELCPGGKLELFSRKQRDGWSAFGDEVNS